MYKKREGDIDHCAYGANSVPLNVTTGLKEP